MKDQNKDHEDEIDTCWFCGISSGPEVQLEKCEFCNLVSYCGPRHQKLHRPKNYCYPIRVARHPTKGTFLVATRDIKPLEVLVDQYPVIHGPYAKPPRPQCLECYKILIMKDQDDGSDENESRFYRCTKCNYPMCGEECENGELHSKNECLVFQQAGYKVDTKEANDAVGKLIGEKEKGNGEIFKDVKSYRSHIESGGFSPYCFISTIRCIMMKDVWDDVKELRDHNEERYDFNPEAWDEHEVNVGIFLTKILKIKDFSVEDIYHSIGVLSVNNANLAMGEDYGKGAGLYVTYSRVNHGCICNTKTLKYQDNRLELRASEAIKKGQEVVNQYVKPSSGTVSRRLVLKNKWHFECDCRRCRDPTEFGSYLSALTCSKSKCSDAVISQKPTEPEADWKCVCCDSTYSVEHVSEALLNAEKALKDGNDKEDIIEHYERFIYEQSKYLHPNNYILINAKMKLGLLYGNYGKYKLLTMSRPNIDRKIQVCQEVLDVFGKVDNGYTSWRTNMLNEATKAKGLLARRGFKEGKVSQDELKNIIASEKMLKCYIGYHQKLFFGDRSDKDMWLV